MKYTDSHLKVKLQIIAMTTVAFDTHLQGKYCEILISTVLLLEKME